VRSYFLLVARTVKLVAAFASPLLHPPALSTIDRYSAPFIPLALS